MTVTVWGECGGPNQAAANWDRYGQLTGAHSYRRLDLDLAGPIEVDADHDGRRLGRLIYCELGRDDRLRAVCVLDGDQLLRVDEPVFFSPAHEMRGRGIGRSDTYVAATAKMIGLSITLGTARVGAWPVGCRPGDLRDPTDRRQWPTSWQHTDPLLKRALDHLGTGLHARTAGATTIVDRTPYSLEYSTRARAGDEYASARVLGPWRHAGAGRILAIR